VGAPKRLEFYTTTFIGLGIAFSTFPYQFSIDISLPFIHISIGLGKAYTEE
jgi:hypothetical protein